MPLLQRECFLRTDNRATGQQTRGFTARAITNFEEWIHFKDTTNCFVTLIKRLKIPFNDVFVGFTHTDTHRHRHTQTYRHRHRHTDTDTQTQTHRHRHTDTQT